MKLYLSHDDDSEINKSSDLFLLAEPSTIEVVALSFHLSSIIAIITLLLINQLFIIIQFQYPY
jgi:hypothetical protein